MPVVRCLPGLVQLAAGLLDHLLGNGNLPALGIDDGAAQRLRQVGGFGLGLRGLLLRFHDRFLRTMWKV